MAGELEKEFPKSPTAADETHFTYRSTMGLSRPSCLSNDATVSGVADWPNIAVAKLPGKSDTEPKMTIDTRNREKNPSAIRWMITEKIRPEAADLLLSSAGAGEARDRQMPS